MKNLKYQKLKDTAKHGSKELVLHNFPVTLQFVDYSIRKLKRLLCVKTCRL